MYERIFNVIFWCMHAAWDHEIRLTLLGGVHSVYTVESY